MYLVGPEFISRSLHRLSRGYSCFSSAPERKYPDSPSTCATVTSVSTLQPVIITKSTTNKYRVIHKSLREFRTLRYSSRDIIKFLPHTLHVCGRNLITGLTSAASPRVDISSTCKVGKQLGVSLPLLTCSPSALPSRLLHRRRRKFRRDL